MFLALVCAALADDALMKEVLPDRALTFEEAAVLLGADRLGPPARTYDQVTVTPGFANAEEIALERDAMRGGMSPASDAHRRYARQYLSLLRAGRANNRVEWFLAEHSGLAAVPTMLGTFYLGDPTTPDSAALVSGLITRDPDLRQIAVAIQRDEARKVWVGVVTGLYAATEFEPFPRVHKPGGVAVIPGTLLAGDAQYALYVNYPGTEVREFPLQGKGAFDIEVPLPTQPGVYRVAVNKQKKRQLPDSEFFFSLYVGEEPPTAFPATPLGTGVPTTGRMEEDFLAQVNASRQKYGLGPLAYVDRTTDLRASLAAMPPRDRKILRWRYVRQIAEKDPLPGVAHGLWGPSFTDGQDPAEAAWSAIEHPITRQTLLDPESDRLAAGGLSYPGGIYLISFVIEPAADPLASRTAAFKELRRRHGGTSGTGTAPAIQAKLDAFAAEVASGKRTIQQGMNDAGKEVKAAMKRGEITGSVTWSLYTVPAGKETTLEGFAPPSDAKQFAIGAANGDLGGATKGIDYTVLIIVAATGLR